MQKFILLVISVMLLSSCNEEKKDAVVSQSPNGEIKISISGKRDASVSPWVTDIKAEGKGLKGNISFEFYGSDLSPETISFVWEGNDKCTLTFLQKDDTKRVFEFTPNSMDGMWKDVSEK